MHKRKSLRKEINIEIEISCHAGQSQIVRTRDISDGGMFLLLNESNRTPEIGDVVSIHLTGDSINSEPLPADAAVVVHVDTKGIGIAYVKMELDEDF